MRTIFPSGHGINIRVEDSNLVAKDGMEFERTIPTSYKLKPKYDEFDNVVVYGYSGNITLEVIKWLSKQNIKLTMLDWDGSLLTDILIPEPKAGGVQPARYKAYLGRMRLDVVKKLIDVKIINSVLVLDWLCQRYPKLRDEKVGFFTEL